MKKPGRNDLCHCGSGKKYKKCCLSKDQHLPWRDSPPGRTSRRTPRRPSPPASHDLKALPDRLRKLAKQGSAKERKEAAELLATTEPLIDYMARREEILEADKALESHVDAFEELVEDEERYLALIRDLCAEERFARFRFTAADIQRAFDHVGQPATMAADERSVQTLRAAMLHIADKDRRQVLSLGLLTQLPDLVKAGRHLEAWLLRSLVAEMGDRPDEPNPFLFEMFSFGYDAWIGERQAKGAAMLRDLGIDVDRLRGMNPGEIDAWIRSQMADPANKGTLEAFFQANPGLREESMANLEIMERRATDLLAREDSRFLLLDPEEIEPWMERFNERAAQSGLAPSTAEDQLSEEDLSRLFQEVALPLMREMAKAVFTRDRIRQLVEQLKVYRNDLHEEGEHHSFQLAMGAIRYVEREDEPGLNSFLLALCWLSLNSLGEMLAPDDSESEG
jgi:hypothetical protein